MSMSVDLSQALAPRTDGGIVSEELALLGIDPAELVDFSSSTNPYGPCRAVIEAVRSAPIARYPDSTASDLRRALAARYDVAPDRIIVGNGAADLLWTLARVLIRFRTPVLIAEPPFAEFRPPAQLAGARVAECRARTDAEYSHARAAIERLVASGS